MVSSGRRSGGCDVCRVRKIKCDRAQPACSQCWAATRACPGYPSMFRNETGKMIQKATKGLFPDKSDEKTQRPMPGQFFIKNPSPSFEIAGDRIFQAECFLFHNYADLSISRLAKDRLRPGVFSGTCPGERALKAGVESIGLANLGNIHSSSDILQSARCYGLAVNEIKAALNDSVEATQDTTLAAIIYISLYEIIVFEQSQSFRTWLTHTQGATALLELRGKDQFERRLGVQMFHAVRSELLFACLQRRERLPDSLTSLSAQNIVTATKADIFDHDNDLVEVIARLCSLLADIRNCDLHDAAEILSIAGSIDLQLETFACNLFSVFPYKVQTWDWKRSRLSQESRHISHYDGCFHIYTSSDACNLWNKYRCARIFVNVVIFKHLTHWDQQSLQCAEQANIETKRQNCQYLMRQLAIDVCLSAPFRLGLTDKQKEPSTRPETINSAAGCVLLFPLYLAATVDGYPGSVCLWVMTCFNFLGRLVGNNAALMLLGILPRVSGLMT